MTVGMWMEASSRTSLSAPSFSFWLSLLRMTVLSANSVYSPFFLTNLTLPKLPEPSSLTTSKSFIEIWPLSSMAYRRIYYTLDYNNLYKISSLRIGVSFFIKSNPTWWDNINYWEILFDVWNVSLIRGIKFDSYMIILTWRRALSIRTQSGRRRSVGVDRSWA